MVHQSRNDMEDFAIHESRELLYDELHSRPSPLIHGSAYVTHFAQLVGTEERDQESEYIADFCSEFNRPAPGGDAVCYEITTDTFEFRWEKHLEFSTYTFIFPVDEALGFETSALSVVPERWLRAMPGTTLVAVNLTLQDDKKLEISDEFLSQCFEGHRAVGAHSRGRARIYSAFHIHRDGFARILVHNDQMSSYQAGYTVKRLLEIETYRNLALLSLPIAKHLSQSLYELEDGLMRLNHEISDNTRADQDEALLQKITKMAARIEQLRAKINYRFSASYAYYDLVTERLGELKESRIENFQAWTAFIERRLGPAVRTVLNFRDRLESISKRVVSTSSLLRTRVELHIQQQNRNVQDAMNRRSAAQYRLQETVERLSIVAIAYYGIGLLGVLLKGLEAINLPVNKPLILAVCVPLVLLLIALITRNIRNKLSKNPESC